MKKLLILLFSLFFLSSPSVFADDISDFEIEGMSIGDSLLDYMTEDEILEKIKTYTGYPFLKEPYKYTEVFLSSNGQKAYDDFSFMFKSSLSSKYITNKNEKYTILFIRGMIDYIEDFDSCIQKRDEIVEVLSRTFPDAQKYENSYPHRGDPSGKSIKDDVFFKINSGDEIEVSCDNFEETFRIKKNFTEGLNVVIVSEEILKWFRNR
jgi:hypothetical protein